MNILLTGGTGVVGWTLLSQQPTTTELAYTYYQNNVSHPAASRHQLDIRSNSSVEDLVTDLEPDVIIHSAAMTDVDDCERNPARANKINVNGTRNIVGAASQVGSHLVFLSTSFVFDGTRQPHEREGLRNPVNIYGQTKTDAERIVESSDIQNAIVRTDQPYGWTEPWQKATMVEWILQQLDTSDTVPVFKDWYNVPTFVPDLADAVLDIALSEKTGIYHAVGPSYISRYEWACEIAAVFGYDRSVISPISSEDTSLPASRPNVYLDHAHTVNNTVADFAPIQDSLEQMVATES
jgi:dTDP-4-dehydrorhamnose reductase